MLAGFRLDGLSAIKHRVNHSPTTDVDIGGSDCLLEERLTSPAVLYIQMSALQVLHDVLSFEFYVCPGIECVYREY